MDPMKKFLLKAHNFKNNITNTELAKSQKTIKFPYSSIQEPEVIYFLYHKLKHLFINFIL